MLNIFKHLFRCNLKTEANKKLETLDILRERERKKERDYAYYLIENKYNVINSSAF